MTWKVVNTGKTASGIDIWSVIDPSGKHWGPFSTGRNQTWKFAKRKAKKEGGVAEMYGIVADYRPQSHKLWR